MSQATTAENLELANELVFQDFPALLGNERSQSYRSEKISNSRPYTVAAIEARRLGSVQRIYFPITNLNIDTADSWVAQFPSHKRVWTP